jgi:translation initiation factor 2 subunit 3
MEIRLKRSEVQQIQHIEDLVTSIRELQSSLSVCANEYYKTSPDFVKAENEIQNTRTILQNSGSTIDKIKGGVIGGSLTQGIFKIGDEIEIKPGLNNEKKQNYEPIYTEITSLGTGAGTVDSVKPGGLVAIGTKLDPTLTRGDSLLGSIVGKPDSLPDNSNNAKVEVSLFDSAVGSANEEKITPIKTGENLRVNIGTAPILGTVTNVKSDNIELSFRRPVCIFEKSNVALSRRISDRWRLIGAGIVG